VSRICGFRDFFETEQIGSKLSRFVTSTRQEVESDESAESLPSDEESLERKEKPNFQEILSEQDPIVMDDETQSDVDLWQRDNQRFREKLNGKCSSYNICLSRF
jgi:hypothetical protein